MIIHQKLLKRQKGSLELAGLVDGLDGFWWREGVQVPNLFKLGNTETTMC